MKNILPVVHRTCWREIFLCKCAYCWIPFPRFGQMLSHLNRHSAERPHECVECRKVFHSFVVYQLHRRVFHAEKTPVVCGICDPRFAFRPTLRQHAKERRRKCDNLVERFVATDPNHGVPITAKSRSTSSTAISTKTAKLSNMVMIGVSKMRTYSCLCCSKSFPFIRPLKEHVQIHRPCKCAKCHKRYKCNTHLRQHVRTVHEGKRPYKCQHCGKTFARRSHLVAHNMTHTGDRNFQCHVCDLRFSHRFQLTAHEPVHSGERRHRCTYCQKQFLRSCDLTTHTLEHMGLNPRQRVASSATDGNLARTLSTQVAPTKSRKSSKVQSKVR